VTSILIGKNWRRALRCKVCVNVTLHPYTGTSSLKSTSAISGPQLETSIVRLNIMEEPAKKHQDELRGWK
jgi:hypothetical protein